MRNWDDDNQYQSDYEDISEQNSAPVEAEYSQPYLVHPQADQPQSNDDFVRQAYRDVLGREADEGGAGWWSSVLDSGGSREDVISAFQNSDEYKALQAASVASTPEPKPQAQQLELWTMQSLEQAQQQVYTPPPAPVQQTAEEPYNDYRGQMDGGNGGWAGAAGGGFFDGMNSSGGDSWYGAGSDYMNNSNDYSAGGNFSIAQYQDASELAGPTFAPPPVAAPVPVEPEVEESEYSGYEYNDSDPTVTADDFSTESYSDDPVEMDPGSDYVIAIPDAPPGPSSHPPINQWGNPVVDMNAYNAQMDLVDNSPILHLANTYTELIDQQGALSNYSFETYQQYQSVVKNNGADSAEAQSLKAMMDRVNTATSAVTAQLEAAETAAMAAFYQNDAQANSLYQQYQGVVQSHGANSAEAQAMYTTYTVARDNTNSGALGNVLQTYHMRHLYDNGGPPDERQQGQSTGSGIMEDLMIGMGLASLSSSTFIQASTEYQAPRAVGHFADPSYGQNAARDAQIDQMNNQAYVNQLISQYTGEQAQNVTPQPYVQPQAPVGQEAVGGFDGGPYQPDNGNESLADAMANSDYVPWESDYPTSDPTISENDFSTGGNETSSWTPVGSPGSHQFGMNPTQNNEISNAINQALNPHLVNVMGTDEMGGITNRDGSYTIEGVDYVNREAAFPSAVDNTVRTDLQTITTTAYRGLGDSDGAVKIILDKQFADPAIQQVNVNGTVYNRPSDGSTNWIPAALQPGVDRLVDAVSQMPGGNFAINSVKAIPGIANALDNGIGNVLGYMENNNGVDAINDVLNAITPSGNSNMAPLGDAMGSGAYEISNVAPDANPRPSNYVSDIKNAAGFIFDTTGKLIDGAIIHPLAAGGSALYNLSTEVLTPEEAAKEFGRVAIGALTAAPFVGGAIKAVGAGSEFIGGVRTAVGVSEALTLDAAAARAGSNLGRVDNLGPNSPLQIPGSTLDGIVMPDGSFMPGSYIREAPGANVPRLPDMTGAPHVEIPGGGVPRLEYVPDVEMPRPVPTPSSPLAHTDDVMPDVPSTPGAGAGAGAVRETVPFEMPQVGNSASNQALDSVQRSIDNAPDLAQRFDDVVGNLRENGVEITGMTSKEMRELTGSGQTAAVFYMDDGVPRIAMLNSLSPGAKYEALLHEVSHRTDYLNPLKNNGSGAIEFSSDAGGLLVPNYREFASVSEFKSHAVEFATQKQVVGAYISEGNLVDAGAVTNRMRETVDARLGVQAELKDSVPRVEEALAQNRAIEVVDGDVPGSQRYVVTVTDANGLPKEVSFPGPAGLNPEQAAAHIQSSLNQVKVDIPINDAALAKSIDELNAFKEVIAAGGKRPTPAPVVEVPVVEVPLASPTANASSTMDVRQSVSNIREQYLDDAITPAQYTERAQAMAQEYGLPDSAVQALGRLDEYSLDNVLTNSPDKLFAMIASPNPEVAAYGQHLLANVDNIGSAKFAAAVDKADGFATLPAADGPLVSLNHGSGGVGDIYKGTMEGRDVIIKADRDPRVSIDSEIEVLRGLQEYGGPELVGRVRVVDPSTGVWREGVAMEPINGNDLLTVLQDLRAGRQPSVQITDAHIAAFDRLEAQLGANGQHLGETNLGDFMITADPNRPIVPLDMMVMDGVQPSGGMKATMGNGEAVQPIRDYLVEARDLSQARSADIVPRVMDMTPPAVMDVPQLFEAQNMMTSSTAIRQAIPDNVQSTVAMQSFDGAGRASGDFVGVYNGVAQGEVHILVGDVSGYGDAAARGSVALQQMMAQAENQALLVQEGLVGLDRVLSENPSNAVNTAMSHLVLNSETGALQATSIGDTSVLVSHVDGAMTEVPRNGTEIGSGSWEMSPAPQPTTIKLRPDDQVYVLTDGIVDRFQSNGTFGLQGIRNAIAQARAQGLTVENTVARLQDHPRPVGIDADDSTAFAFQWHPPGQRQR